MKNLVALSCFVVFCHGSFAQDFGMLNLSAEYAVEQSGEDKEIDGVLSWNFIADPVGVVWRVPVNMSVEELQVLTNSAAFTAWLAERNAPAIAKAAARAQWESAMVDLMIGLGVAAPGTTQLTAEHEQAVTVKLLSITNKLDYAYYSGKIQNVKSMVERNGGDPWRAKK